MNKEQTETQFEQLKGKFKTTWSKLTDDDITLYNGQRARFYEKLQKYYGLNQKEAENKIQTMEDTGGNSTSDKTKVA
jgi:uncharacterized protein YjbJ (UPF0337 family)